MSIPVAIIQTESFLVNLSKIRHLVLAHLYNKVPRPGNSKGTISVFESSCHLLLPV